MMELTASHCSQSVVELAASLGSPRVCRRRRARRAAARGARCRVAWLVLNSLAELELAPNARASGLHMHAANTISMHIPAQALRLYQPGVLFGREAGRRRLRLRHRDPVGATALGGGVVNGAGGGGATSSSVSCVRAICRAIRAWICSAPCSRASGRGRRRRRRSRPGRTRERRVLLAPLDGFTLRRVRRRPPRQEGEAAGGSADGIAGRAGGGLRGPRPRRLLIARRAAARVGAASAAAAARRRLLRVAQWRRLFGKALEVRTPAIPTAASTAAAAVAGAASDTPATKRLSKILMSTKAARLTSPAP